MQKNKSSLFSLLKHPGYQQRFSNSSEVLQRYAENISAYRIAMSGGGQGTPRPYVLAKNFEIPATGTVLLTDEIMIPYLQPLGFELNTHYIAASSDNLLQVVEGWLRPENRSKLEDIAEAGRHLVKVRHTIEHRSFYFDQRVTWLHSSVQALKGVERK